MTSTSRRVNVTSKVSRSTVIPLAPTGSVFGYSRPQSPEYREPPVWAGGELHPSWQHSYAKAGIAFPQGNPYQWIMQQWISSFSRQAVERRRKRKLKSAKTANWYLGGDPQPQPAERHIQIRPQTVPPPARDDAFTVAHPIARPASVASSRRRRRLPRQYTSFSQGSAESEEDSASASTMSRAFELEKVQVIEDVREYNQEGSVPPVEAVQLQEDMAVIRRSEGLRRQALLDDDRQRRAAELEVIETERRLTLLVQERTQMQRVEAEFRAGLTQVVMNLQRIVLEREAEIKRHKLRRAEAQKELLQTAVLSANLVRDEFEERRNLVIQEVEERSTMNGHRDQWGILLLQKHEVEITEIQHRELVLFQERRDLEFIVSVSAALSEEAEMRICLVEKESELREDLEHSCIQSIRIWKLLSFDRTHLIVKAEAHSRTKIRVLEELRRQWLHRVDDISQHEHELRMLIRKRERDEWIDIVQTAKRMQLFVDTTIVFNKRVPRIAAKRNLPDARTGDPSLAYVGDSLGTRSRYLTSAPHVNFNLDNTQYYHYPYTYQYPYTSNVLYTIPPTHLPEMPSPFRGQQWAPEHGEPLHGPRDAYNQFLQNYFLQSLAGEPKTTIDPSYTHMLSPYLPNGSR